MGPLKYFRQVVHMTTLGNFLYMQINAAIAEKSIFLTYTGTNEHIDTKMVSTPTFARSKNKMRAQRRL